MLEDRGRVVCDSWAICEYLDETRPEPGLLGKSLMERAEIRRLVAWFDMQVHPRGHRSGLGREADQADQGQRAPNSAAVRSGLANIHAHLDYIGFLFDRRNWLAGDALSLADIAAAAQLSVLDYLGDVPWDDHPGAKLWYARIKSRPSFRPLLQDRLPGLKPAPQYDDLDF